VTTVDRISHDQTTPQSRPVEVVVIDHSYHHLINWAEQFAKSVTGIKVVLVTDKSPSRIDGDFEVINVRDVTQNLSLDELQLRLNFSLYRALITERAYFDYTHFTKRECYSRLTLDEIGKRIRPHINALDVVIRTRADLVIGHMADNAVASLAAHIANQYGKPYVASTASYWSTDGLFIRDRIDQTSSQVDELYRRYYANQSSIDRSAIQTVRAARRFSHMYSDITVYSLRDRIKKIIGSRQWHDPFSPINWLIRRVCRLCSQFMIAVFGRVLPDAPADKRYVLYPMHVAPEAALLGATPELADQFSLIKNISINLPWGVRLCVKGHPAQHKWSGPNFDFYRKLAALKNVDVISAKAPTDRILRDPNCIAVAIINGTVGLEAAANRKPVFVFGRAMFGVADCFLKPKDFDEFRDQIMGIAKGQFQFNEGAMWAILAALDAAVWHGDKEFALAKSGKEATLQTFSAFERYIRSGVWQRRQANHFRPDRDDGAKAIRPSKYE
jgi:hypothetical protein